MGFLQGRPSFIRFRVEGRKDRFGKEDLQALREHAFGSERVDQEKKQGWSAGGHVLDTEFDYDKNVIFDALHFEFREDTDQVSSSLVKAYYEMELKVIMGPEPRVPTKKMKREAKEAASDRLNEEAKTKRFRKHKAIPVLWHGQVNEVWFGGSSHGSIVDFMVLFERTFGSRLHLITAGTAADRLGYSSLERPNWKLSQFHDFPLDLPTWAPDGDGDFIGNEFLVWLWWHASEEGDTMKLTDGTEVVYMLTRSMRLECPRAMYGQGTLTHSVLTQMPEAYRALRAGKLPRKTGLVLVRRDDTFELTLHAETLAVGSLKLPQTPEDYSFGSVAERGFRVDAIRDAVRTYDLMFELFCLQRFGEGWDKTLKSIKEWIKGGLSS